MTTCPVCIEDYKGKKIVQVTCQYCPTHACRGCQQRYLLQSYEDPHCMDCKRGWSPEFMAANFPLSFRKDTLRKHRRKILLEREKATLPAMQIYVEHRKVRDDLAAQIAAFRAEEYDALTERFFKMRTIVYETRTHISSLKWKIQSLKNILPLVTIEKQGEETQRLADMKRQHNQLKLKRDELEPAFEALRAIWNEAAGTMAYLTANHARAEAQYEDRLTPGGDAQPKKERREFIMKCPDEGCRGFLSSAYKCGTCEKYTCTQCLVVLGPSKECGHSCKADDVETAKTIKAETRPCPKCGTRIFKIDGCDMMWCTIEGCNTAFSWNTGDILAAARIHNPHYYEWLRRTGGAAGAPREAGDIPCGGLPAAYQLMGAIARIQGLTLNRKKYNIVLETHRNISELIEARLPNYPLRPPTSLHKDNDVRYLMKEIDEAEWMRQLELVEARFNRKKEISQILSMVSATISEVFRECVERGGQVRNGLQTMTYAEYGGWITETMIPQMEHLRAFVNEAFLALAKRDKMAVPQFGENWKWMPARALYRGTGGASKKATASTDDEILEVE